MTLLPDGSYHLAVGSTEMGNGSVTSHKQIAAAVLGARADSVAIINADTDLTPYDTGTFASTGTVVAGQAVGLAAAAVRDNIIAFASRHTGVPATDCRLEDEVVVCGDRSIALSDLHAIGARATLHQTDVVHQRRTVLVHPAGRSPAHPLVLPSSPGGDHSQRAAIEAGASARG